MVTMIYCLYKLKFPFGLHLGNGSLSDYSINLCADTLFSALCIEALKKNCLHDFVNLAKSEKMKLSDAFPFIGKKLYIPKPIMKIKSDEKVEDTEKIFKNLKYIPLSMAQEYAKGNYTSIMAKEENTNFKIGKGELHTKVSISRQGEDVEPYHVGVFRFFEEAGLYFIAYVPNNEIKDMLSSLLTSLSATGIGGKKSTGIGQFTIEESTSPVNFDNDAPLHILLSVGLPKESEMQNTLINASYSLIKRSGFVSSSTYAETFLRKKDLFVFSSGSVFKNKFTGDIYDVSNKGAHPVYSYAMPIFLGIDGDF